MVDPGLVLVPSAILVPRVYFIYLFPNLATIKLQELILKDIICLFKYGHKRQAKNIYMDINASS